MVAWQFLDDAEGTGEEVGAEEGDRQEVGEEVGEEGLRQEGQGAASAIRVQPLHEEGAPGMEEEEPEGRPQGGVCCRRKDVELEEEVRK